MINYGIIMAKSKKIKVLSFAKFPALLFALLGLIAGILYSFGGLAIDTLVSIGLIFSASASTPGLSYGTIFAFGALVGMPLIFAVVGFIVGIIEAVLYNKCIKWLGGLDVDFDR
jgi:hypothetical protein